MPCVHTTLVHHLFTSLRNAPHPTTQQVPRSCRRIAEDQDYVLMSVVLFRRTVDDFKTAARVRGFQVTR